MRRMAVAMLVIGAISASGFIVAITVNSTAALLLILVGAAGTAMWLTLGSTAVSSPTSVSRGRKLAAAGAVVAVAAIAAYIAIASGGK